MERVAIVGGTGVDGSVKAQGSGLPSFCTGLTVVRDWQPGFDAYPIIPAVDPETGRVGKLDDGAAYQTMLAADALRFLTLQMTASKANGHPGGFASSADAVAALAMLGHKNLVTEVGHHAPGYYSLAFLDRSLERMGINTVSELCERYREHHGLLGHITPAIPGMLAPAGPLGQGPHFAMALALLHPKTLVPLTIGDGGMGEPYVLSGMLHFNTAWPEVTNFLPVLIWNGYSQEHQSMCSTWSDTQMVRYFTAHGFKKVVVVDAKAFDDAGQPGSFVDSTLFSLQARVAFTRHLLQALDEAAASALGGTLTAVVVKQLKGSGVHVHGSKAHNLVASHTLQSPLILEALQRRALAGPAWALVRSNLEIAGGGPTADIAANEQPLGLPDPGTLPVVEHAIGTESGATAALGEMVVELAKRDPGFIVTNADGNEASGMMAINRAMGIRHPATEELYEQRPDGMVYEPLSEDACAGLAAALAVHGSRALWCSYESFAVNGLPVWQTAVQALAELRRKSPSALALFTAGALEQGRNGWTHQRPEVEAYLAAMMRNGNVYPLFPVDANMAQAAFAWALDTWNAGVAIFASKSPLPVRSTMAASRKAIEQGYLILTESDGIPDLVIATVGDIIAGPALDAATRLAGAGVKVRVVAVVNPRRFWRPEDLAWEEAAVKDDTFLDEPAFDAVFGCNALLGVAAGSSAMLEPLMLRSRAQARNILAWKRGDTTAGLAGLLGINGLDSAAIHDQALKLLGRTTP
jgi:phosphoketolase